MRATKILPSSHLIYLQSTSLSSSSIQNTARLKGLKAFWVKESNTKRTMFANKEKDPFFHQTRLSKTYLVLHVMLLFAHTFDIHLGYGTYVFRSNGTDGICQQPRERCSYRNLVTCSPIPGKLQTIHIIFT